MKRVVIGYLAVAAVATAAVPYIATPAQWRRADPAVRAFASLSIGFTWPLVLVAMGYGVIRRVVTR